MANSRQQIMRGNFESCLGIIRQASVEILTLLGVHETEGKDPGGFLSQLDVARLNLGSWAAIARRLCLNDVEISSFTLSLHHLQPLVVQYQSGNEVGNNHMIAALRVVSCLEQLREKQPLLRYKTAIYSSTYYSPVQAQRQIRALELMMKAIIERAYPERVELLHHLNRLFGTGKVKYWVKQVGQNNVLDELLFSELALLIVDRQEYAHHYRELFQDGISLGLLAEPRKTLQVFLNDVRTFRNKIIHGQPLLPTEIALLDHYFQDVSAPVLHAFNEARTTVNPIDLLDVSQTDLKEYFTRAKAKNKAGGGDTIDIRSSIERPDKHHICNKERRTPFLSGAFWGGITIVFLIIGGLYVLYSRQHEADHQHNAVHRSGVANHQYVNNRARQILSSMGIDWNTTNLRGAIDRGDVSVVRLFLQGGMEWRVSWTELAQANEYNDVLRILLSYRQQMEEKNPCRRMISTISYAQVYGEPLTGMRKEYLRAFCRSSAVIERQAFEVEKARQRVRAGGNKDDKRWLNIQNTIYKVMASEGGS